MMDAAFRYAEQILEASRSGGHIMIDLAAEIATRENLLRILDGIGCPRGPFLKLAIFYCNGNVNSPVDQNGRDFITNDVLSKFAGWGVYCIGCDVGRTLGHKLLKAGAHFVIAFDSAVMIPYFNQEECFQGLNSAIVNILLKGSEPSVAVEQMREKFESLARAYRASNDVTEKTKLPIHMPMDVVAAMAYLSNAHALQYYGPAIKRDLKEIQPGREQATKYQIVVAEILYELFSPYLDEPHLEVSNESGASRYDIVFMNRAERGFWHDIKVSRGNSIVIFDAKNKKELATSDADQMLRYSGHWRGQVIFVVCREKQPPSFNARTADLLKEHKVCLIVLSDMDLEEMYSLKRQGNDPTLVIERLYRQRIERA